MPNKLIIITHGDGNITKVPCYFRSNGQFVVCNADGTDHTDFSSFKIFLDRCNKVIALYENNTNMFRENRLNFIERLKEFGICTDGIVPHGKTITSFGKIIDVPAPAIASPSINDDIPRTLPCGKIVYNVHMGCLCPICWKQFGL